VTASAGGRRFIVEADGGSRGNPGPAGYGALVRDASTGEVLGEAYDSLGVATNNFAEYQGLLAGLKLARSLDASAFVEVRMDSRLVVEQMSGRWQVKHPDLRPLAREASSLSASFGSGHVSYTWVPRERNKAADALANKAMDAAAGASVEAPVAPAGAAASATAAPNRLVGWEPAAVPTTLVLVRHGVTTFTVEKRFSGIGDPPLIEQGRVQAAEAAERLAGRGGIDVVVSSPLARCRETAGIIAKAVGAELEYDDGLRECDFGAWEGLTFAAVQERWPRELDMWLADTSISPPGGESYDELRYRISVVQQRLVNRNRGRTLCVVTHSRPVAMFVANALDAPVRSIYRLHVDNASVTELDFYDDGARALRAFNDISHLR
jgi:broad specificity phosphatase PhoE/ribonuclease HI